MNDKQIRNILLVVFGVGGIGVGSFALLDARAQADLDSAPQLSGSGLHVQNLTPTPPECRTLTKCGGEPCDRGGMLRGTSCSSDNQCPVVMETITRCESCACVAADKYEGTPLALGLREAMDQGAVDYFHTDVVATAGGQVTDCLVNVWLTPVQWRAWSSTIDTMGARGRAIDSRRDKLPARYRRGNARLSVPAGVDPEAPDGGTD
jgi:hypothetical protein